MLATRICKICKQEFQPTHFNQTICKRPHFKQCPVCGKDIPWTEYDRCCSKECTTKMRKATCLEKYGVEYAQRATEVKEKSAQTCLSHYGVTAPAQNKQIKERQNQSYDNHFGKQTNPEGYADKQLRTAQTSLKRYGTANPMQSKEIKDKAVNTNLEKYGVENCMQATEVQAKMRATMKAKYGVENCMQAPEVIEKIKAAHRRKYGVDWSFQRDSVRKQIAETNLLKYGVPWYCMTDDCKEASGKIISKLNLQWVNKLADAGISTQTEFRIANKSYDLKVADQNVLIEIDPTFTHNCMYNPFDHQSCGLDRSYHLTKTKIAQENGYRCIHVFDWDDTNKIVQLISPKESIYARQLQVREVPENECDEFLSANHIQNSCKGQSVRLGLYDSNNQLLEIMTFGSPRYNKNYQWELIRLCSHANYSVVGGASKLFSYFLQKFSPQSIISYCDISKFDGKVYSALHFNLLYTSEPAKIWAKGSKKITDNLLRQRGYDQLFNTTYGKGTSNEELMLTNNWLPIYDCGQYVFEWRNS